MPLSVYDNGDDEFRVCRAKVLEWALWVRKAKVSGLYLARGVVDAAFARECFS